MWPCLPVFGARTERFLAPHGLIWAMCLERARGGDRSRNGAERLSEACTSRIVRGCSHIEPPIEQTQRRPLKTGEFPCRYAKSPRQDALRGRHVFAELVRDADAGGQEPVHVQGRELDVRADPCEVDLRMNEGALPEIESETLPLQIALHCDAWLRARVEGTQRDGPPRPSPLLRSARTIPRNRSGKMATQALRLSLAVDEREIRMRSYANALEHGFGKALHAAQTLSRKERQSPSGSDGPPCPSSVHPLATRLTIVASYPCERGCLNRLATHARVGRSARGQRTETRGELAVVQSSPRAALGLAPSPRRRVDPE